jgi:hypothetical protein
VHNAGRRQQIVPRRRCSVEFRITIDVFSGRKNPVIELKGKEAAEMYERLRPARRLSGRDLLAAPSSILGYRGLIVEQSGARGLPKSFRVAGGDLESRSCLGFWYVLQAFAA